MSAIARSSYGQQDVANSDLRHRSYIMNLDTSEPTVLDKYRACCAELILNY